MSLVPVGKRRMMVAQMQNPDPAAQANLGIEADPASQNPEVEIDPSQIGQEEGDVGQSVADEDPSVDPNAINDIESEGRLNSGSGSEPSLTKDIIEFLVSIGYPFRKLRDYKDKLYSEKGGNDGGAQVTITLPNQVYNSPDASLPSAKVIEFVRGIEKSHGLHYEGYSKSDLKLVLNLSRMGANDKMQQMQDGTDGGVLDKVYGKPSSSSTGGKEASPSLKSSALSMRELIKTGKIDFFAEMEKNSGKKDILDLAYGN